VRFEVRDIGRRIVPMNVDKVYFAPAGAGIEERLQVCQPRAAAAVSDGGGADERLSGEGVHVLLVAGCGVGGGNVGLGV
jgi:hypothetical protein